MRKMISLSTVSSGFWIFLIIAGGAIATFATMRYPISKEYEKKIEATTTILDLIDLEVNDNLVKVSALKTALTKNEFDLASLDINAWTTISNTNLIIDLDPNIQQTVLNMYSLTNKVNKYHDLLMESNFGPSSALTRKKQHDAVIISNLNSALNELELEINKYIKIRTKITNTK